MPMFCKKNNEEEFDIKPICEIVKFDETKKQYQSKIVSGMQVWGKTGWVDVTFASAYPHDIENDNKHPRFINSRTGAFMATAEHVVFMDNNLGKEVKNINLEDRVENIELPKSAGLSGYLTSKEEAELMGMMVGDGSITYSEKGTGVHGKFTNSSDEVRERFNSLWKKITGGHTVYYPNRSGFNPERIVGQLILAGGNDWLRKIDIYNNDRTKRIPKVILNSTPEIMLAFLRGYNITDGLKSNPCTYDFRNFKTNSPTLAMGLWYLIDKTTRQDINLTLEMKNDGRLFYSLNILSTVDNSLKEVEVRQLMFENLSQREISRRTQISRGFVRKIQHGGCSCAVHHFKEDPLGVKKIIDLPKYDGWFYDLETTSGEFHCGVGKCHVHNSPRRGETFVTRKVTRAIARIIAGEQDKLYLGNLSAKRDWGYAPEYVELMWKILQQNKPQDFVVGTGHSHSVEEFVKAAFKYAGLCYKKYVKIDKRYFRPTEVNNLIADGNKAKKCFGWQPKIKFLDLIKIMVDADMRMLGLRPVGESDKILKEKIPYKWWNMD
ncbi:MAG: GDP-mannose 4,6-dehydratase [Candidatus Omnitrophota bacterium]